MNKLEESLDRVQKGTATKSDRIYIRWRITTARVMFAAVHAASVKAKEVEKKIMEKLNVQ